MSNSLSLLLVIFIGIIALVSLAQGMVLLVVQSKLAKLTATAMPIMEEAGRRLPELLRDAAAMLRDVQATVKDTRTKIESVTATVIDVTAMARGQAERADALLNDVRQRVQAQVERADQAVADAITGFENASTVIQRTLLRPVNEINAWARGVRTGLDFFFRRRSSPPPRPRPVYEDEEMFI